MGFVNKFKKLQELYFRNWLVDPVSKIINILLHLGLHKKFQNFKSWIRQKISSEIVRYIEKRGCFEYFFLAQK